MDQEPTFFFREDHQSSNIVTETGDYVTVTPNHPGDLDEQDVFIGISMDFFSARSGEAWTAIDVDELRDALDKAMDPRGLDPTREDSRIEAWNEIADHRFFAPLFSGPGTPEESLIEQMIARLDRAEVRPSEGHLHTYEAKERNRHLRHIEDIESALGRRNRTLEEVERRNRELLTRVAQLEERIDELEGMTPEEHMEAAWDAAEVPEDGNIHDGEWYINRYHGLWRVLRSYGGTAAGADARIVKPRPEFTEAELREKYESAGLDEWEIEMLIGGKR